MKKLISLLFLFCGFISFGQSLTEKWNTYQNRYEYFNSSNQLVGYKKYNTYTRSWEYYDEKPVQQQVRADENFELWANVAVAKQQRYDYNKQRVQNAINEIRSNINALNLSPQFIQKIKDRMNKEYLSNIQNKPVDLSIDVNAENQINYLWTGYNKIMKEESALSDSINKERQSKLNESLMAINYLSGGYFATQIIEEKYNPVTKEYEKTSTSTSGAIVYLALDGISFFRQDYGKWKYSPWTFKYEDEKFYIVEDNYNQIILIDKSMKIMMFYAEPIGGIYQKRFTYLPLEKDITIKKPY